MLAVFQPAVGGDSSAIQAVTIHVQSACWSAIRVLIRNQGPRRWQWVEQSGHTSLEAVHESMMQNGALAVGLGDELQRVAAAEAVHPVAVRLRRRAREVEQWIARPAPLARLLSVG